MWRHQPERKRVQHEVISPELDTEGKSIAQGAANRASETGRQAMDRAGEFIEGVAPRARETASNLYEQGSQTVPANSEQDRA